MSGTDSGAAPDHSAALSVRGLTKTYRGGATALSSLDLDVPAGSLFALLGPNGAGKSTLIGTVCNVVRATSGRVLVFGHDHDTRQARHLVGVAEQEINVDRFLSIRQMLMYHAGYHGIGRRTSQQRVAQALELFRLGHNADVRAYELSGGMQRRLVLARALVHRPRLLILDEPTAGVDVELRTEIWRIVKALNAAGTTILLTTHYLEEAQVLSDRIALISGGRLLDSGTPQALHTRYAVSGVAELYDRVVRGLDLEPTRTAHPGEVVS